MTKSGVGEVINKYLLIFGAYKCWKQVFCKEILQNVSQWVQSTAFNSDFKAMQVLYSYIQKESPQSVDWSDLLRVSESLGVWLWPLALGCSGWRRDLSSSGSWDVKSIVVPTNQYKLVNCLDKVLASQWLVWLYCMYWAKISPVKILLKIYLVDLISRCLWCQRTAWSSPEEWRKSLPV